MKLDQLVGFFIVSRHSRVFCQIPEGATTDSAILMPLNGREAVTVTP